MTGSSDRWHDLDLLLDRVLDGLYGEEDVRQLNQILRADAEACRHYMSYVELHGRLAWGDGLKTKLEDEATVEREEGSGFRVQGSGPANHAASFLLPHSFQPLIGGALVSYAITALIIGIGIVSAWAWRVSDRPRLVADGTVVSSSVPAAVNAEPLIVGRISQLINCKWRDPKTAVDLGASVAVGRKFDLASGVLEIAYDGGARVILQESASYEVDSRSGGVLSRGKLTARIGMKEMPGTKKLVEVPNYEAERFRIRTPSSIAKCAHAELGILVDEHGASRTHLFEGLVELLYPDGGNPRDTVSSPVHAWAWITWLESGNRHAIRLVYRTGELPSVVPSLAPRLKATLGVVAGAKEPERRLRLADLEARYRAGVKQPTATAGGSMWFETGAPRKARKVRRQAQGCPKGFTKKGGYF